MSVYGAIAVFAGRKLRARPDTDVESPGSLFNQREQQLISAEQLEQVFTVNDKDFIFNNIQGDPRLAALWNDMVEEVVEDEALLAQIENKVLGHVSDVLRSLEKEHTERLLNSPDKALEIMEALINEGGKENLFVDNPKALKGFYSKYFGCVEDVKLNKTKRDGQVIALYDVSAGRGLKEILEPHELDTHSSVNFVPPTSGPVRVVHVNAADLPAAPQARRQQVRRIQPEEDTVGAGRTPENSFQTVTRQLSEAVLKFVTMIVTASLLSNYGFKRLSLLLVKSYSQRYFSAFKRIAGGLFATTA
jgi:hypothetical protein